MTVRDRATDIRTRIASDRGLRTRSASERGRRGRLLALRVLIGAADWPRVV
jgi:hypothetical protein